MKRILRIVLLLLLLTFPAGCGRSAPAPEASKAPPAASGENIDHTENTVNIESSPLWRDEKSARVMIISDLHYTGGGALGTSDVSGMSYSEEITDDHYDHRKP